MPVDFIDFDAAWSEEDATKAPPRIVVLGETIDLPRGIPAAVVLFAEKQRAEGIEMTTQALTVEFIRDQLGLLIGVERVDRWLDCGITLPRLYDVYLRVGRIYAAGDDSGEARPPETGDSAPPSSPAGVSSKPTGDASTERT